MKSQFPWPRLSGHCWFRKLSEGYLIDGMARVGRYSVILKLQRRNLPTCMPVRIWVGISRISVSEVVCWEKQLLAHRSGRLASFADCRGKHGRTWNRTLLQRGKGGRPSQTISLPTPKLKPAAKPLTVFRAELTGCDEAGWEDLFAGYTALKAITFSSSIEMLLRLAERLDDVEVVFGSESILSKEHLALAQASQTIAAYGFADALIDQKALVEALSRLLGRAGRQLLDRVVAGSLRFRLLRGRPSHEKLYLLSGPSGSRVLTGSANLGRAAFEGWQHEILVAFDGEPAWRLFDGYYQRDWKDSVPVEPDALIAMGAGGAPVPREEPLAARRGADRAGAVCRGCADRSVRHGRRRPALQRTHCGRRQRSAPNSRTLLCRRTRPAAPSSTQARCCA